MRKTGQQDNAGRTAEPVPDVFTLGTADGHGVNYDVVAQLSAAQLDSHPVAEDMANLRANLPFVSIVPWPKSSFLVTLAQNIAAEIRVPDNAVLVKISGQASFLFTEKGSADGKTSALAQAQGNPSGAADILASGETEWMYCAGLRSFSVRNPNATEQLIGARFIFRDEI